MFPPNAFSVVASPVQSNVFPFTDAVGPGFTVTVVLVVAEHPLASVTVTVYPVVDAGFTVCDGNILPLFHENEVPPEAVSVAVPPGQMETLGDTKGVGKGLTVTFKLAVSAQVPLPTITEYVPDEVGVMEMEANVLPVLHEKAVPPEAVSVVLAPVQMDVLPEMDAVILEVTVTVATAVAEQDPAVTSTV